MDVSKLLPEVYYKESRDFSYVGRILEVVFNYLKTGADIVGVNPNNENVPNEILELACATLGFESKHKYIKKDLVALASDFINLCRNKGSLHAVEEATRLLLTSQGISEEAIVSVSDDDSHTIVIKIPHQMTDIILLEDIFEYILPSGTLFKFEYINKEGYIPSSKVSQEDIVNIKGGKDSEIGQVSDGTNMSEEITDPTNRSTFYTGVVVTE